MQGWQYVIAAVTCASLGGVSSLAQSVVQTFDGGNAGWSVNSYTTVQPTGGNPGANLRWPNLASTWWVQLSSNTAREFLGDYTRRGETITMSVDVKSNFVGSNSPRDLILELRDYENAPAGAGYVSVWIPLGRLSGGAEPWRTLQTTFNPRSTTLPPGWGGTGAYDFRNRPILPANRTFASVVGSVDEVVFTTARPGVFYLPLGFDVAFDNVRLTENGVVRVTSSDISIEGCGDDAFASDADLIQFFESCITDESVPATHC